MNSRWKERLVRYLTVPICVQDVRFAWYQAYLFSWSRKWIFWIVLLSLYLKSDITQETRKICIEYLPYIRIIYAIHLKVQGTDDVHTVVLSLVPSQSTRLILTARLITDAVEEVDVWSCIRETAAQRCLLVPDGAAAINSMVSPFAC
jgi:hypothetical protein